MVLSIRNPTTLLGDPGILATKGAGWLDQYFTETLLARLRPRKAIVFPRDELKQHEMAQEPDDPRLRLLLQDVPDRKRLVRAFDGMDFVVNAAALRSGSASKIFAASSRKP